jgi:hypothetical protein
MIQFNTIHSTMCGCVCVCVYTMIYTRFPMSYCRFHDWKFVCIYYFSHVCHVLHSHNCSQFVNCSNLWWTVKFREFLLTHFSPALCYFSLIGPNIFSMPVFNHSQLFYRSGKMSRFMSWTAGNFIHIFLAISDW